MSYAGANEAAVGAVVNWWQNFWRLKQPHDDVTAAHLLADHGGVTDR